MAETETPQQQEPKSGEGAPREGAPREGASEKASREGATRETSPRESGPREGVKREGGPREGGPREGGRREGGDRGGREGRPGHGGERREGGRGDERRGGDRGRFEGPPEIDLDKLISDPLYLDNQAHGVVSRMRDMDSGTRSQLRRLYNAVRRAVRAPESERQQQFVMLRARLAYTIARHSLRSLDSLEKLLLQVTRKNDARGYERFRDLFEAIVAYNE
jgi:CRISPR type III-A-associated protein Csm2